MFGAIGIYALVVFSAVFSIGTVYFAYRLSRITGRFGAWTLMITALILVMVENLFFSGSVVLAGPAALENSVSSLAIVTMPLEVVIVLGIPLLFFAAMYKLYRIISSSQKVTRDYNYHALQVFC